MHRSITAVMKLLNDAVLRISKPGLESEEEMRQSILKTSEERALIVGKYDKGVPSEDESEDTEDANATIYTSVDQYGFFHKIDLPTLSPQQREQRTSLEVKRREKWLKMVRNWPKYMGKEKLMKRVYKGIPQGMRGDVWRLLLGVHQYMTEMPDVYKSMKDRALLHSPDIRQIHMDVNRTYRDHLMFKSQYSIKQQQLFYVLAGYSVYNTEVGYCQGMSQIAALLLMYMDEEEAFWAVHSLLYGEKHRMHGFFIPGFPKLLRFQNHHDKILTKLLPKIKKHLDDNEVFSSLYTMKWFFQCFLDRTPFSLTLRLWDIYILEGEKLLTAMSYAIIKMNKALIKREDMDGIVAFLQEQLVRDYGMDDDAVIENLKSCMNELRRNGLDLPPPAMDIEKPKVPFGSIFSAVSNPNKPYIPTSIMHSVQVDPIPRTRRRSSFRKKKKNVAPIAQDQIDDNIAKEQNQEVAEHNGEVIARVAGLKAEKSNLSPISPTIRKSARKSPKVERKRSKREKRENKILPAVSAGDVNNKDHENSDRKEDERFVPLSQFKVTRQEDSEDEEHQTDIVKKKSLRKSHSRRSHKTTPPTSDVDQVPELPPKLAALNKSAGASHLKANPDDLILSLKPEVVINTANATVDELSTSPISPNETQQNNNSTTNSNHVTSRNSPIVWKQPTPDKVPGIDHNYHSFLVNEKYIKSRDRKESTALPTYQYDYTSPDIEYSSHGSNSSTTSPLRVSQSGIDWNNPPPRKSGSLGKLIDKRSQKMSTINQKKQQTNGKNENVKTRHKKRRSKTFESRPFSDISHMKDKRMLQSRSNGNITTGDSEYQKVVRKTGLLKVENRNERRLSRDDYLTSLVISQLKKSSWEADNGNILMSAVQNKDKRIPRAKSVDDILSSNPSHQHKRRSNNQTIEYVPQSYTDYNGWKTIEIDDHNNQNDGESFNVKRVSASHEYLSLKNRKQSLKNNKINTVLMSGLNNKYFIEPDKYDDHPLNQSLQYAYNFKSSNPKRRNSVSTAVQTIETGFLQH